MTIWLLILFAGGTAFLFRVLPFFMKKTVLLNNARGNLYRFLSYSSQAMLGVIVYDTVFHHKNMVAFVQHFDLLDTLKLVLLLLSFIWTVRTKSVLASFFFFFSVYILAMLLMSGHLTA